MSRKKENKITISKVASPHVKLEPFKVNDRSLLLMLLALTLSVYAPSFVNDFINLDDPQYITENTVVQSFNIDNLKLLFNSSFVGNYQPITMFSYMVEYHFWGANPKVFHLTNLLFHLGCTLLVFFIFKRITKKNLIAFITAALFSIHPLHVESVAWVSARKDVVYAFFFLFSMLTYIKYIQQERKSFFILSLVLFILSLLSKAQAVTLPIVLLLVDYLMNRPLNKKAILEKVPFLVLSVLFGILAYLIQNKSGAVQDFAYFPVYERVMFACYGLINYFYKLFIPLNLSLFYPYPETNDQINTNWVYVSPVLLLAIALLIYKYGRKSKAIVFGVLFFLLTIALVLQIIPVGDAVMADRYTYIPLIGIFFIAAYYFERWLSRGKQKRLLLFGGVSYLLVLGILSFLRTREWKDSITIYTSALKNYPAAIVYNNRGAAYSKENKHKEALEDFNNLLKLKPRYPSGNQNRGITHQKLNNHEKAIEDFTSEIKINPKNISAYSNRGNSYKALNKYEEAIKDYSEIVKLDPGNIDAYYNRGESYGRSGKYAEAIADFNTVIAMKPDYAEAYSNRGIAYSLSGNTAKALEDFNKAIELNPKAYNSYMNRSVALKGIGRYEEALKDALHARKNGHNVEEGYIRELEVLNKD